MALQARASRPSSASLVPRACCSTQWHDARSATPRGWTTGLASTVHVFAHPLLAQGKTTGFHGTATNRSRACAVVALGWRDGLALRRQADLTSAPTCSVCGATSQLHRRCLACLGVTGSCLAADQPPNSARASRQGGSEPTPTTASGGAGRPDETKAACRGNSAAPSLRGLRPDGWVEASCAKAARSMPESEPDAACKNSSVFTDQIEE